MPRGRPRRYIETSTNSFPVRPSCLYPVLLNRISCHNVLTQSEAADLGFECSAAVFSAALPLCCQNQIDKLNNNAAAFSAACEACPATRYFLGAVGFSG
jgi:hypothetical protein